MHYGIGAPEKWAPTLESPPFTTWIFVSVSRLFASNLCCVFPLEYFLYAFYTGQLWTGETINFLATYVFREKIAIYNLTSFERNVYLRNASSLESFCFD